MSVGQIIALCVVVIYLLFCIVADVFLYWFEHTKDEEMVELRGQRNEIRKQLRLTNKAMGKRVKVILFKRKK